MNSHTVEIPAPATVAAAQAAVSGVEPGERVVVVVPDPAPDFASEVRLQLLRRQADVANVQVGLVSKDADISYFAGRARIPVFDSLAAAEGKWRYPKPAGELPPPASVRPMVIQPPRDAGRGIDAPAIVTAGGRTIIDGRSRHRKDRWWLRSFAYLVLIVVVAGLVAALGALVIPQATVTLTPAQRQIVSSLQVTAQTGIDEPDYLNEVVPARTVQARVEGFASVDTTGAEDAPVNLAGGGVTFFNQTGREVQVPANTIVRTATGNNVRFRTLSPVTVPAGVGQRADVGIEAVEPGRQGNVPALTISEIEGPLNVSLRVSNQSATGGGTVANVAVVTQADKDRVLGQLQGELQQQAYEKLGAGLRQGEYIPSETVNTFTLAETYDRFSGEQSPTLGLQLQLLARGLAVDLDSAADLTERALRDTVPSGHFLLEESLRVGQPSFVRFDEDAVVMTLTASGDTLIPIRSAEVRSLLAGVPFEEAASVLQRSLDLADSPVITLEPNWLGRLPYIPTRIRVRVLQPDEATR
ncbi:MAG: baseplate J/gp47 family protein [Caldilineales bacterium]|nr:baseplate J/gp47 family protein [Caldilineales bacterium]